MPDVVILHSPNVENGMVDKVEPWLIGEKTSAYLQNLDLTRPGSRKRRFGVSSIGATTNSPGAVWRARTVLNTERLFGLWGGKIYRLDGSGSLLQAASSASCCDSLHMAVEGVWSNRISSYVCAAQVNDSNASLATNLIAIQDAADTASQCASMSPYCMTWFQNRLWVAGNTRSLTSDDVWWSELGDGLSYSAVNTIRAEPGVGGRVTALKAFGALANDLVIFKERAICVFTPSWGSSSALIPSAGDALDLINSNLRTLTTQVGCVATRSVQQLTETESGVIVFLSLEGFRYLQRSQFGAIVPPSKPISDQILTTIRRINFAYARKCVSTVWGNLYLCAVPLDGATENTHTLVFDYVNGGWSVWTWTPKDICDALLDQTADSLFFQNNASTSDSGVTGAFAGYHVYRGLTGFQDPGGGPVVFQEYTRGFVPGQAIGQKSNWDRMWVTLKNDAGATCAITVLYNIDQSGWVTGGSLVFPGGTSGLITLGVTPLPWQFSASQLATRYLSLVDAPVGYEIQLGYISSDTNSIPSVLDIGVIAKPIGVEQDNTIN